MSELEIIEQQVERLDAKAFAAFREWFIEYEHARWDQQLAADSSAGKLDSLVSEALAEYKAGKSTPFETSCVARFLGVVSNAPVRRAGVG